MGEFILSEFDYDLPDERIAQHPATERDKSRLLVFQKGEVSADIFSNIDKYIPAGNLLVFNNTQVVRARLLFSKSSGSLIEILCLEPLLPGDYSLSFSSKVPVEWKCLVGNLKKWKNGILNTSFRIGGKETFLSAENIGDEHEARRIRFSWSDTEISFAEVLEAAGHIPLPPYINREDSAEDAQRYQTVYSRIMGSVAAPTAGLHFTDELLRRLSEKGIKRTELTLHVGAGTFRPVKGDDILKHEMHTEHFTVTKQALSDMLEKHDSIISVGTTTCRTLETLYWLGVKVLTGESDIRDLLHLDQWEPYRISSGVTFEESMEILITEMERHNLGKIEASTGIIIMPGYEFRVMKGLVTNFHQPKSTLLLLVAAWTGNGWRRIYRHALDNEFRFLSYGDSSILFR